MDGLDIHTSSGISAWCSEKKNTYLEPKQHIVTTLEQK